MKMDKKYYVNAKELTLKATLPRPSKKYSILVCDGEWLPKIMVETDV